MWQETVECHFSQLGFAVTVLHPAVYHHERDIKAMVHVDDFLVNKRRRSTWSGLIGSQAKDGT